MENPLHQSFTPHTLYDVLATQLEGSDQEASWLVGMNLRGARMEGDQLWVPEDPWSLDVYNPQQVYFRKPPQHQDQIDRLRPLVLEQARPFFVEDVAWDGIKKVISDIYTNQQVMQFMDDRQGNLVVTTQHFGFHDVEVLAAASFEVRRELPADNPFFDERDPASGQVVVANRMITSLEHPGFKLLTNGLPLLEGMMLPFSDVLTTISANGSGKLVRLKYHEAVQELTAMAGEIQSQQMLHGGYIYFEALTGNPPKQHQVELTNGRKVQEPFLVLDRPSKGTVQAITEYNQGAKHAHKTLVAAIFLDGLPISQIVSRPPQTAVVAPKDIYVPTNQSDIDLILREMLRSGIGHGKPGGLEFRYGKAEDSLLFSARDYKRLGEMSIGNYV
jgi:hypothetical protein